MPPLPFPILVLRDAVIVLVLIVLGGMIAAVPYGSSAPDPRMIQVFQAVFGTVGFAACGWLAKARRPLRLSLAVLVVWILAGLPVLAGRADPAWWFFVLSVLALMAILGGGMALLLERLARE